MTFVVRAVMLFDSLAHAEHVLNQTRAVAQHSGATTTGAGRRTSYMRVDDLESGEMVAGIYRDRFGIVRDGRPGPDDVPPEWVQPQGAHDSYPLLDVFGEPTVVTFEGVLYRNVYDAQGPTSKNSWRPAGAGAFGWVPV